MLGLQLCGFVLSHAEASFGEFERREMLSKNVSDVIRCADERWDWVLGIEVWWLRKQIHPPSYAPIASLVLNTSLQLTVLASVRSTEHH